MAAMQFACPHCTGLFQVDSSFAGQQISCPHCRGVLTLPPMGSQAVAPSVPATQEQPVRPMLVAPQQPAPQQPAPTTPKRPVGDTAIRQRPTPLPKSPAAGGAKATATPNRRVTPVPQSSPRPTPRGVSVSAAPISLPASGDPLAIKVREPVKTVGVGDDAVELKSLSPESRARWRWKKNLLLWAFGLIVIGITLAVLLLLGPIRI